MDHQEFTVVCQAYRARTILTVNSLVNSWHIDDCLEITKLQNSINMIVARPHGELKNILLTFTANFNWNPIDPMQGVEIKKNILTCCMISHKILFSLKPKMDCNMIVP